MTPSDPLQKHLRNLTQAIEAGKHTQGPNTQELAQDLEVGRTCPFLQVQWSLVKGTLHYHIIGFIDLLLEGSVLQVQETLRNDKSRTTCTRRFCMDHDGAHLLTDMQHTTLAWQVKHYLPFQGHCRIQPLIFGNSAVVSPPALPENLEHHSNFNNAYLKQYLLPYFL